MGSCVSKGVLAAITDQAQDVPPVFDVSLNANNDQAVVVLQTQPEEEQGSDPESSSNSNEPESFIGLGENNNDEIGEDRETLNGSFGEEIDDLSRFQREIIEDLEDIKRREVEKEAEYYAKKIMRSSQLSKRQNESVITSPFNSPTSPTSVTPRPKIVTFYGV